MTGFAVVLVPLLVYLVHPGMANVLTSHSLFPSYVEEGGSAMMRCNYDTAPNKWIKWYKDNKEFYTYDFIEYGLRKAHSDLPSHLVETHDDGQMIILTNVTKAMAGTFQCEITVETETGNPTFITEKRESILMVVRLPKSSPAIEVSSDGQNITLVCRTELAESTRTEFDWYKNYELLTPPGKNVSSTMSAESSHTLTKSNGTDHFKCTVTVYLTPVDDAKVVGIHDAKGELIYFNQASVILGRIYIKEDGLKEEKLFYSVDGKIFIGPGQSLPVEDKLYNKQRQILMKEYGIMSGSGGPNVHKGFTIILVCTFLNLMLN